MDCRNRAVFYAEVYAEKMAQVQKTMQSSVQIFVQSLAQRNILEVVAKSSNVRAKAVILPINAWMVELSATCCWDKQLDVGRLTDSACPYSENRLSR